MAARLDVQAGTLKHGLPFFAFGSGPALVVLRGFTTSHTNPTGLQRAAEVRMLTPLARRFRVYAVNRPPGMRAGTSMAEVAGQHADALRAAFADAVDVLGMSSGGSVALQLAADHPGVVRRLVVAGAGYRLGPVGKAAQLRYIDAVAAGRRGGHFLAPLKVDSVLGARLLAPVMWLFEPLTRPKNPADMVAFARAEDGFDLGERLGEITAPTLVICGERDNVYTPEIFRSTADGVRDGRLIVYPTGHGGTFTHRRFAGDVADFLLVT